MASTTWPAPPHCWASTGRPCSGTWGRMANEPARAIKSMTLLYVGEEPPVELARYELNGQVVKLTMRHPAAQAKAVTEESMKGVLYMPVAPEDGDEARMVMPSE